MSSLYSVTQKIDSLTDIQIEQMFSVFSKYYQGVDREKFVNDLKNKDAIFLLYSKKDRTLKGFSTILKMETISDEGKIVHGFFSGDTVLEKEFWGDGTLGVAFLKYLFKEKIKRPFTPLYWFLISKGYKTYLLMANNFGTHWPRFEQKTPVNICRIMNTFAHSLYGDQYLAGHGIIRLDESEIKGPVKIGVANITNEMMQENKRISFFATKNPGWNEGDELCCLAEMSLLMPIKYQYKILSKLFKKMIKSMFLSIPTQDKRKTRRV